MHKDQICNQHMPLEISLKKNMILFKCKILAGGLPAKYLDINSYSISK